MLSGHVCPYVLPSGGMRTRGLAVFIVFNILQVIRHLFLICTVLGTIRRLESNMEEVCVTITHSCTLRWHSEEGAVFLIRRQVCSARPRSHIMCVPNLP